VRVVESFEPAINDPESIELKWVPAGSVEDRELHPAFASAWPQLWRRLAHP
jgi:hypothetical protein